MRFCPFCAKENPDDGEHCAHCGKKLPPAPRRSVRRADPTLAPAPSQARPATTRFQLSTSTQPSAVQTAPSPVVTQAAPPVPSATTSTLGHVVVTSTRLDSGKPLTLSLGMAVPQRSDPPRSPDGTPQGSGVPVPTRSSGPGTGPIPLPPPPASAQFPEQMQTPTAVRDITGSIPVVARPMGEPAPKPAAILPTPAAIAAELPNVRHAKVMPMPRVPNAGNPAALAWYVIQVVRAISQRSRAIKRLRGEVVAQQETLDGVLGVLGRAAAAAKLDMPAFAEEMRAITLADGRRGDAEKALGDLTRRREQEDARFAEQFGRLRDALQARQSAQAAADSELRARQNDRQKVRDELAEYESRIKAYGRSAEDKEASAGRSEDAAVRAAVRREAESLRNEARRMEGPRDAALRRLDELSKPLAAAEKQFDTCQRDTDQAKRSAAEAQNAHDQVMGEITAQVNQHQTQQGGAERELARHHVTLGTMVNLHRVDRPELKPIYERIDSIRRGITGLEAEVEHLKAERYARDRATMQKGILVLSIAFVVLVGIIVLLSIVY